MPIENFPNYEVSNCGKVRNTKTLRVLKPKSGHEYARVTLYNKNGAFDKSIHRLVAETFMLDDYDETLDVNHKDGFKYNSDVNNLEWCTRSENLRHAFRTGLKKPSGPNGVQKIRIVETGDVYNSIRACARSINGSQAHISRCLNGERETHKGYHFERVV